MGGPFVVFECHKSREFDVTVHEAIGDVRSFWVRSYRPPARLTLPLVPRRCAGGGGVPGEWIRLP